MRRVTLRSIWEHKRRLISTVVAIVLGVAFMSGTAVFADTLNKVFDDLFATASENVDARVQGEVVFGSQGGGDQRARFDDALVDTVAAVDGVAAAEPFASTIGFGPTNRVLDADGDPVGSNNGPPTLIETWVDNEELSPYELTEGSRPPESDDEIAINVAAAEDGAFTIGDTVTVASQLGNREYTLVGTFTFGDSDSAAGAVAAEFTLAEAQRLAGAEGQLDAIFVVAEDGLSQEDVVARLAPVLPDGTEAITGEEAAEQDADSVQEGLAFFSQFLSIFGMLALIVGIFIIANTFQILVAQRTRELALLRAVGASRRQVLGSVLLEAAVVGLVAAVLGIAVGVLLAWAITAALSGGGVDLPTTGLVVSSDTIVQGLLTGLLVTAAAAIAPAIRATRVPPLAALRTVAIDRSGASRIRLALGVVVLVLGGLNLSRAWSADGDTDVIPSVGLGALLILVGAVVVGPVLAGPSVRTFGSVLPRLRGVTGRLATENAARSPKRTSATASALLIGVALVAFITVAAESIKRSVAAEFERGINADVFVQPEGGFFGGFSGFSPQVAEVVRQTPGVEIVGTFSGDEVAVTYPDGDTAETFAGAVDPAVYGTLTSPRMVEGELSDLTPGGVIVDVRTRDDNDLEIGDVIQFRLPAGDRIELAVEAVSDDTTVFGPPWILHQETYAAEFDEVLDFQVFATVEEGASVDAVIADIQADVDGFPSIEVLDREDFEGDLVAQLSTFVNFIYGLLALSIIIAMIGVANTISLSVHERTKELGLLRAVGMTRGQLRSSIRWEAVLISVLGAAVGVALGLLASYALVKALEGFGLTAFGVPVGTLAILVVVLAALGVVASLLPARRAARLDVLKAIGAE